VAVDEKGVQEASVVEGVFAEFQSVGVREGPADIVVGADVVDPGAAVGDVVAAFEGLESIETSRVARAYVGFLVSYIVL
jgi:hypothetical protein